MNGAPDSSRQQELPAIPGFVCGCLLASLIDCHGTGTARGEVVALQMPDSSTG